MYGSSSPVVTDPLIYPESDGLPMGESTVQFRWITLLVLGLQALFRDHPLVFVAGDLFWYPVEGRPDIRRAPDAMVVFGRPPGDRGSYLQWKEAGIGPQVVFEIVSPGNTPSELAEKWQFYQQYGVEEYYLYTPETKTLEGWLRQDGQLRRIAVLDGWQSPRLAVRFDLRGHELQLILPNGEPMADYATLTGRLQQEQRRAEQEQYRAEQEQRRAEQEQRRAERLAAQLRALGVDPEETGAL